MNFKSVGCSFLSFGQGTSKENDGNCFLRRLQSSCLLYSCEKNPQTNAMHTLFAQGTGIGDLFSVIAVMDLSKCMEDSVQVSTKMVILFSHDCQAAIHPSLCVSILYGIIIVTSR